MFFRRLRNYLRVKYLRWRFPKRPMPENLPYLPIWTERADGLYKLTGHTASPEDETDYKKFPVMGGRMSWSGWKARE